MILGRGGEAACAAFTTATGFTGAACYKTINPVTGGALYFKPDGPNLIKNLRGAFLVSWAKRESSVRQLQKGGGKISFGFIKEIWQREQGRIYKETKLTAECIYPNNFQKMGVPLAARIFQMPVVRELKAIKSEERYWTTSEPTGIPAKAPHRPRGPGPHSGWTRILDLYDRRL